MTVCSFGRGLQYISIFMKEIVADHEKGLKTENMVPHVQKAYEESLKMYHGWIIQKVFTVSIFNLLVEVHL